MAKYIFMAEVETAPSKTPEIKEGEIKVTHDIIENPNKIVQEEDWSTKLTKKRNAKNAENKAAEARSTETSAEKINSDVTPDVPSETTVVEEKKTEEPKVEKTEKKKFKKFWDKTKTPTEGDAVITPTTPVTEPTISFDKLPKDIQERLKRADVLEGIVSRPSVKLVLKAEETSGKDFRTYYSELLNKDPFKIPNVDVYKMQLEDVGGYTQTEIDRKVEKFLEKDEDDQADIIAPFRKTLKDNSDKETTDWTPKFEQPEPMVDDKALAEVAKTFENKEIFGIMATPQMVKETYDYFNNSPLINIKDGKFDPQDLFTKTFLIKNFELIVNEAYEGGFNDGLEKLEQQVTQPLSTQIGSHQSQPRKVTSDTQKRIDSLKGSLPKTGSPTQ